MCTKILTLLLVPLLVLGHSFAHVPCGAARASQEDNRTHFHVKFGTNHDHSHDHGHDHESPSDEPHEHDSDAIYLIVPDGEFSTPNAVTIDCTAASIFGHLIAYDSKPTLCMNRCIAALNRIHGPPLYLLCCAIRI